MVPNPGWCRGFAPWRDVADKRTQQSDEAILVRDIGDVLSRSSTYGAAKTRTNQEQKAAANVAMTSTPRG